jgi:hypothetical protein
MNVRHELAERILHNQECHDEPVKYLRGRSIVWLFGHDVPCLSARGVASSCEVRLPSGRAVLRFAEVTIVIRNLDPFRTRSLPTVRRPIYFMWLNRFWSIARLVWDQQPRIQGEAADARCCPLTLLLCFTEAVEVAFPRQAPRIFLGVNGRRGQRRSQAQCDSGKRRKSGQSNSRSGVAEGTSRFWTEYYSGACFLSVSTRSWIA